LNYSTNIQNTGINQTQIELPSSKSEANRLLIINALANKSLTITNLSQARDTQTLDQLLNNWEEKSEFDVLDAGTAMRFLTAFLAINTQKEVILTGTERMQQRPIKILVEALNSLGCHIEYVKNEGYPPLRIQKMEKQSENSISIPGNISSQYISALLMIAPSLPDGLSITIEPPIFSKPYINMTLSLMKKAGIHITEKDNTYHIASQNYRPIKHRVESDWSAASYWFSIIALSPLNTSTFLVGLRKNSYQGDQAIVEIMEQLGVETQWEDEGIRITKKEATPLKSISLDFKKCPDLAQTVLVASAALGINLELTGLESLKIKETDRVVALQKELSHFGAHLIEDSQEHWSLKTGSFSYHPDQSIHTYEDHRMAMSFAPLGMLGPIIIEDVDVVNKSYPGYWKDLKQAGFELKTL
jgi:3-phosphoshikimate 1-carboxyvinyltransferase